MRGGTVSACRTGVRYAEGVSSSPLQLVERVCRPSALRPNQNYLLPQFQTALGTVVHATPLVQALRAAQPQARIVVASSGLAAQVWEGNPFVDRLLLTPSPLKDLWGAVAALRQANPFDDEPWTTLLTTGNERTRITLAAVLAGPSQRVGFAVRGELMHQQVRWDPAQSQIANNLRLLETLGFAVPARGEPTINAEAQRRYASELLGPRVRPRFALATQTSVTQRKSWRVERWVELARTLRDRYDAELVFVGTAEESASIDALRGLVGFETISVAGRTSIAQLAAVFSMCDLGVVLDTGPLHVARAVGLPAVVIAPAWSPPHEWLPIENPRYRILKNRDFPPPAPEDYVIDEVSVAEVLQAVAELLPLGVDA